MYRLLFWVLASVRASPLSRSLGPFGWGFFFWPVWKEIDMSDVNETATVVSKAWLEELIAHKRFSIRIRELDKSIHKSNKRIIELQEAIIKNLKSEIEMYKNS